MKNKRIIQGLGAFILTLLFTYASLAKLIDITHFQSQLSQSPLIPQNLYQYVAWGVPTAEIICIIFLYTNKFRLIGFYTSLFVMTSFTIYLILLVNHPNVPCSCGGILGKMSWHTHIWFNFFL